MLRIGLFLAFLAAAVLIIIFLFFVPGSNPEKPKRKKKILFLNVRRGLKRKKR